MLIICAVGFQLMSTLRSQFPEIRDQAAQIMGKIAEIEIPANQWPRLIPDLLGNMTAEGVPTELRQSTLQALGYICENISPEIMQDAADHVLTAVVRGMQPTEADTNVKLAAVKTLTAALEFSETNWKREAERTYLMKVIVNSCGSADVRVRRASFECLVRVASLYYDYLEDYIKDIFAAAYRAITEDEEDVAKQAIEFWSSVCDVEVLIIQAEAEGLTANGEKRKNMAIVRRAVPALVPVLTNALLRGAPNQEMDTWNISMAAGTCLDLIANTVGDEVVPYVLPFVDANIGKPEPRNREVALLAFGSILQGPVDKIRAMLDNVLPHLMGLLADASISVKDTTAWCLGRVAQFHGDAIRADLVLPLAQRLVHVLGDDPRVAANSCWALNNLAELAEDGSITANPFGEHFVAIVKALLAAADRDDADESNLRSSAYETINAIVKAAPDGLDEPLAGLVTEFMQRINQTFNMLDREEANNLQGLLCGVLQTLTRRLDSKIAYFTDNLMNLYFRLFQVKGDQSASLHEEALLAVGALINSIGGGFEPYMVNFMPFLLSGVANRDDYHVCSVAVGTVGDLCRALGPKLLEYSDNIIHNLENNVGDPNLHRSVKTVIISCFGDLALAISGSFAKYLPRVMDILKQASDLTHVRLDQTDDWEEIEYMQGLRHALLEAYSGILLGLNEEHKADLILGAVNGILHFLHALTVDTCRKEEVARGAVGLLGDIVANLGPKLSMGAQIKASFGPLIDQCLKADTELTRDTAQWTKEQIEKNFP